MKERWMDIKGFEGYYMISSLGRVKSLNYNQTGKERLLKQGSDKDGYLLVVLCYNGKKTKKVHRLVAEAFIPKVKDKNLIHHKNNIKFDNNVNNLKWTNISQNTSYAYKDGLLSQKGSKNNMSKLTEIDIHKIRNMYNNGVKQKDIALKFNVRTNTISRIISKKRWSHI